MTQPECFDEDLRQTNPGACSSTFTRNPKDTSQLNPFYTLPPPTTPFNEEHKIDISLHPPERSANCKIMNSPNIGFVYHRNAKVKGGNPLLQKFSFTSSDDVKSESADKTKSLLSHNIRMCSAASFPVTSQKSSDKISNDRSRTMDKENKTEEIAKCAHSNNTRANMERVVQPLNMTDTLRRHSKLNANNTIVPILDNSKSGVCCNVNLIFCKSNLGCVVI